jgi:membrane associated rhomboid family serine protease
MGFYDRDYYREPSPRGGLAVFRMWSVTTWLIVINVAVFFLDPILGGVLGDFGYFSIGTAVFGFQVWRFITFQFLHANLSHIFFNMIGLYFFGPIVESYLGSRRYLAFYLISGIGGGLGFIVLHYLGLLHEGPNAALIGASAGIFGILIAAARIGPDIQVMLLFPPIPMRLRTMAWVCVGIAAYTVLTSGNNAGGQAAHLGGAVVGYFLIQNDRWLDIFTFRRPRKLLRRSRGAFKDWSKDFNR